MRSQKKDTEVNPKKLWGIKEKSGMEIFDWKLTNIITEPSDKFKRKEHAKRYF